jgi:hypothetical protein
MKQLYLLFCLLIIISCEKDKSLNTPPKILQLNFEGVKSISTNIDSSSKIITVEVPYQTSISALVPIIGLEDGVTVVPASGLAQNFAQDVYYTLSKNSNKLIYTVKVKVANQPKPEITLIKTDTVEAGKDLSIVGKNFGKFSLDILAFLVDNENKESLLKHQLIDSTQIKLTTSIDYKVGFYRIKVKIKNQEVIADTKIWLAYPSPQLTSIPRFNLLKGDTLWLIGKYIDASKYNFLCQLSNRNATYQLAMTKSLPNQLGFILPNYVTFGEYEVKIYNASEKKLSGTMASPISIYEPSLPYVNGILNYQLFYKNNDKLIFKTSNFDKIAARFYQVSLVGSDKTFIQNGIYDATKQTLSIDLPDNIKAGVFFITFSLTDPSKNIIFSFKTDLQLTVKD